MEDMTLYLLLLGLIGAFWIYEIYLTVKSNRALRGVEKAAEEMAECEKMVMTPGFNGAGGNLRAILSEHGAEEYFTLPLLESEIAQDAYEILHSLLPGDKLNILSGYSDSGDGFQVFAEGRMIGRLSAKNSGHILDIMRHGMLKGVFVWKQNCYGECDYTDLSIIVFYRTVSAEATRRRVDLTRADRMEVKGRQPFFVFAN